MPKLPLHARASRAVVRAGLCGGLLVMALVWRAPKACATDSSFSVAGAQLILSEVTNNEAAVFYQSMRLNRALNAWNVDVWITNTSARSFQAPLLLRVDGFSGTAGPMAADGTDTNGLPFFDLSANLPNGVLQPNQRSTVRTLTLAVGSGVPKLHSRLFEKRTTSTAALIITRSLNEVGQPLPGVQVTDLASSNLSTTEPDLGAITLSGPPGARAWKFAMPGFYPVWRQQNVSGSTISVLPSPRLSRIDTNVVNLTPIEGGTLSNGNTSISFPPGAFARNTIGHLKELTGQTLPALLPGGWSPLSAFWLQLDNEPAISGTASLIPWGAIASTEIAGLVKWDETNLQWTVVQTLTGNGTNALRIPLGASGAYALVVGDIGPLGPTLSQVGQALAPGATAAIDYSLLNVTGTVRPTSSPASRNPELVTGTATLSVSNSSEPLSSGLLLRGQIHEDYRLRDGTHQITPEYENYIVAYQRPASSAGGALQATFPMRPILLLGPEELDTSLVQATVFSPSSFTGGVLDDAGGEISADGITIVAGSGDVSGPQAISLHGLNPTNFLDWATNGLSVAKAFELVTAGIQAGHKLVLQAQGLAPKARFVLAKVLTRDGIYGLEPRERLVTDGVGRLSTVEPLSPPALSGITGAGQYVLIQVSVPQGLVTGVARNSAGVPAAGLLVQSLGAPWMTFSDSTGAYKLVAPAGNVQLAMIDPTTGDRGTTSTLLSGTSVAASADLTPVVSGPTASLLQPTNGSVAVATVSPVVVGFSEAINPGTLGTNGVQLFDASNALVNATLTLNLQNTVATLLPIAPLAASAQHTVLVSSNILDLNGRSLAGTNAFTFTTASDALNRTAAELVSYEPTNGIARMEGGPGIADPNSPVILVNETTGGSSTILSNPDGSITNTIAADVDDFLSVVLVNQNGIRITIPVSRQVFQDGSIGLFNGGGILEAQSDGAPLQVLVEPGSIPNKTKFKVEPVALTDLLDLISNTPPSNGQLLGGFKISTSGDPLSQPVDVAVALDTNKLTLPTGMTPDQAGYALVAPRDVDGFLTYEIIDRMHYENGKLVTHSPPFGGFGGGADFLAFMATPFLNVSISGRVLVTNTVTGQNINDIATVVSAGQGGSPDTLLERRLPGALVSLDPNGVTSGGRLGRLRPGTLYARANQNGFYAFLVPVNSFNAESGVATLFATHPQYPKQRARRTVSLPPDTLTRFITGNTLSPVDIFFLLADRIAGADKTPPEISISHSPFLPPLGSNCEVRVLAVDNANPIASLSLTLDSVQSLVPGVTVVPSEVVLSNELQEVVGAFGERNLVAVSCDRPALVLLRASAADSAGNLQQQLYPIAFGGSEGIGTNIITSPDPNDHTGPVVVWSDPQQGGASLAPGGFVRLVFNEPIDRAILNDLTPLQISPALHTPLAHLSDDQRELTLTYYDAQPGTEYSLTVTSGIKDLAGNRLDQDPTTSANDAYVLKFSTAPGPSGQLSGIGNGAGTVFKGIYSYALERGAGPNGFMSVYDLSTPTNPVRVAQLALPGFPRDLALIPDYAFKEHAADTKALTNDLLAVAGGIVTGGDAGGQFLWIINISDPVHPQLLGATLLTLATDSAVVKLAWSPPQLGYLELAPGNSSIGLINLQSFLLGAFLSDADLHALPPVGTPGVDVNGDGDYVDPGDSLPVLGRSDGVNFFGWNGAVAANDTDQPINDFALERGGGFAAVVLGRGKVRDINGFTTSTNAERAYRTLVSGTLNLERTSASYEWTNATPVRLSLLLGTSLIISNQLSTLDLALVSLKPDDGSTNRLEVLDITDPTAPRLLNEISIPTQNGDSIYSISRREDGKLLLATSSDLLILDPSKLAAPQPTNPGAIHPAIIGVIAGAGSGARSFFSSINGLTGVNLGGKHQVLQAPPLIQFVNAATLTPFDPRSLTNQPDGILKTQIEALSPVDHLQPSRFRTEPDVAESSLSPPSAASHYYALIRAPGSAGPTIDLAIESLNWAAQPLRNKGYLFPPVHSLSDIALAAIGQMPTNCDPPAAAARAWRLSANPSSDYYNVYLSKPIALVYEEIFTNDLAALKGALDREILWSGSYLRATLDPSMSSNTVLAPFASKADRDAKILRGGPGALAPSFPADFIMGPSPGPLLGAEMAMATLGSVAAHNSETLIATTDMALPGRRLPIEFRRTSSGQALYEGPFGRGWDFNYNQRVIELKESLVPAGIQIPQVIRGDPTNNETGQSKDLFFLTGAGRTLSYRYAGTTIPSDFASDPLVKDLAWDQTNLVARYYSTPQGAFNMFVKFRNGKYARLEPDGTQYWYNPDGRLETVYDRYTINALKMVYNDRGELIQIQDELNRAVDIGYWRSENDGEIRQGIDQTTNNLAAIGKICQLKDYSERNVLFLYDSEGLLERREGPNVTVTGTADSFTGRQKTHYLYSDPCNPGSSVRAVKGVVVGDPAGTPLTLSTKQGTQGRETVDQMTIAGKPVTVTLGQTNTARQLMAGNATMRTTGLDGTLTDYLFDKFGRPQQIVQSGSGAPAHTSKTEYYDNGMVKKITFGEGNSVEYTVDISNVNLRSRANILKVTKNPGPRGGPTLVASKNYDPKYNLESGTVTDYNGNNATVTLSADLKDIETIDSDGETEQYSHNKYGQVVGYTSKDGITRAWTFDDSTGFMNATKVGSHEATFTYEGDAGKRGLATSVTDARGITTSFVHDERNQIASQSRSGFSVQFGYNENGYLTKTVTSVESGRTMTEERIYNQVGFMTSNILHGVEVDGSPTDLITTYEPDDMNRIAKATFPGGDVHQFQRDHMGQVTNYTIGDDYSEQYAYDLNGNRTSITIGDGTEEFHYDGHDRLVRRVLPSGAVVDLALDNNGNLLTNTVTDADSAVLARTSFTVDALNRYRTVSKKRSQGPDSTVTYDYDSQGRSVTMTDALQASSKIFYDDSGRIEHEEFPTRTVKYQFDGNANLLRQDSIENGATYTAQYTYNNLDQLTQITDSANNSSARVVELDGRLMNVTDRENHTSHKTYTEVGEVASATSPNNVILSFNYNNRREPSQTRDTRGNTLQQQFDEQGRLVQSVLPNGATTVFSQFDALNNAQHIQMPRGVSADCTFDNEGQIETRSISMPGSSRTEKYEHDGLKRLTSVSDNSGSVANVYDQLGFIKEFDYTYSSANLDFNIGQEADAGGFRANLQYPGDGPIVTCSRDNTGRLLALQPDGGADPVIKTTTYAADSLVGSRSYGAALISVENSFDVLKRLVARNFVRNSDGKVLVDVRYAYDKDGAMLARQFRHRAGRADFFQYDPGYRLTRVDNGARPQFAAGDSTRTFVGFQPDSRIPGNWRAGFYSRSMSYDNTDVLQGCSTLNPDNLINPPFAEIYSSPDILLHVPLIDGVSRTRDEIGDVTQVQLWVRPPGTAQPEPVLAGLEYNELGQLVRVQRQDGVTVVNEYGPSGLRIRRTVTGDPSRCVPSDVAFVYDGGNLIETRDVTAGNAVTGRYFYGDGGDELIAGEVLLPGNNDLARIYFLTDVVRSVLAVTDEKGEVVERASYDAWGEPVIESADVAAPRVSRVLADGNDLLIEFTESVLPAFAAPVPSTDFITKFQDVNGLCVLQTNGVVLPGTISYEENLPGHEFGSVFRFHPTGPLASPAVLQVAAAQVQDEWDNPNSAESLTLDLAQTDPGVFYSGSVGSTAPTVVARSTVNSPFLFHGQVFDYDTGLIYCRARFYDPSTGLFLQPDPAGYVDGANPYAGFANNPVNFRDSTGESILESHAELGQQLSKAGSEVSIAQDGLGVALVGVAYQWAGSLLQLGSGLAEGMDLMQSEQPGTLGTIDRVRGAELIGGDVLTAADVLTKLSGVGKTLSNFGRRMEGFEATRPQSIVEVRQFFRKSGYTALEADAIIATMKEQKVTRLSIRSFRNPAARISNRWSNMECKPMSVHEKTDPRTGIVVKNGIEYTSDADIFHLEIDGRNATLQQSKNFREAANAWHGEAMRRRGGDIPLSPELAKLNPPFRHGTHLDMAKEYSHMTETGNIIDNAYIKSVGHPGDTITIRTTGDGNIVAYETPRWWTHEKIKEYENILVNRQREVGLEQPVGFPFRFSFTKNWHAWWYTGFLPKEMPPFGVSP